MARRGRKAKRGAIRLATIEGWTRKEVIETKEVPNPLYSKVHHGKSGNPEFIDCAINVRESGVVLLEQRKHINKSQVQAADRFRGLWEAMGGSGVGAFDYSREPVDGGGARDPLTERQATAGKELAICRSILGVKAYGIMCKIIGEGHAIGDLATTQRERKTLTDYLKDGLDELARHWGYENHGSMRKSA